MCTYVVTSRMNTGQEPLTAPFPPPCPSEDSQHRDPGKDSIHNPDSWRCQFTFSDGRRCRNQRASLCAHHASKASVRSGSTSRENSVNEDSLPALEALCGDLTTATNINRALAQVFLLMAQGRIAQKQAVAFGYLAQLLLQTVPGIRSECISAFGYDAWQKNLTSRLGSSGSPAKGCQFSRESLSAANVYPSSCESYGHQEL